MRASLYPKKFFAGYAGKSSPRYARQDHTSQARCKLTTFAKGHASVTTPSISTSPEARQYPRYARQCNKRTRIGCTSSAPHLCSVLIPFGLVVRIPLFECQHHPPLSTLGSTLTTFLEPHGLHRVALRRSQNQHNWGSAVRPLGGYIH